MSAKGEGGREDGTGGTGSRHGYRVFTELKTLGPIWNDGEEATAEREGDRGQLKVRKEKR